MKIYFGCGQHKINGFIGVDKIQMDAVDLIHDMNLFPYPFLDNCIDEILLINILEHLPDTVRVIEEIWRICKQDATVRISVPYYNSPGACSDPTHVRFFTESSFDYFTKDGATGLSVYNYYSKARFDITAIAPCQKRILNFFPKKIQYFLAHHLCTIHNIEFVLQAIKY